MTTSEIAKKLGISRGTVSRVINNNPNVKPQTREMVLAELERCAYKPNVAARSLVMKRSCKIAVIVFSEPSFFWDYVRRGVETAATQLQMYGVTVDYFSTDILKPEEQLKLLRELPDKGYEGIILAPNNPYLLLDEMDTLSKKGIAVLLINVDIPTANRLCYVGCDYTHSGAVAAEILASRMDRSGQLLMLALQDPVVSIEQRIMGFRQEFATRGGSVDHVLRFNRKAQGVYDEVRKTLVADPDRFSGIYVAFSALEQTAQALLDLNLAGKISVVGYDFSREIYDFITREAITATVNHEPFNQGFLSVWILHNYLSNNVLPKNNTIHCKLEVILRTNGQYYLNESEVLELLKI